jgi:hypothetical protein
LNVSVNDSAEPAPRIFITSPTEEVRLSRSREPLGGEAGSDKIQAPAQILNGTPSIANVAKNLALWHPATLVHISATIKFRLDINLCRGN